MLYMLVLRLQNIDYKGLGAIRAKIGPTSNVYEIFSKMYSQYVLSRNKYRLPVRPSVRPPMYLVSATPPKRLIGFL
jgi:hypothetical protein